MLPCLDNAAIDWSRLAAFAHLRSLELRNVHLSAECHCSLRGVPLLEDLSVYRSVTNSTLVRSLPTLKRLQTLRMKDVRICGDVAELDSILPSQLTILEIDKSPQMTQGSLLPIFNLQQLKSLMLGLDELDEVDMILLSAMSARISLVLYRRRDLHRFYLLGKITNLKVLKFDDFGICPVPTWIKGVPLESLAFANGQIMLTRDQIDTLPSSLTSLEITLGPGNDALFQEFMHFCTRLTELTLNVPCFARDIHLSACTNLTKLKIAGKEFDGEGLTFVSSLVNLTSLQVCGCLKMDGSHVRHLLPLNNLELSICSCTLTNDAYEELAALPGLKKLSFYFCHAMRPCQLKKVPSLESLQFGYCVNIENNLKTLLDMPFISDLAFIGFKFMGVNDIPPPLQAFCDRQLSICIDLDIPLPE